MKIIDTIRRLESCDDIDAELAAFQELKATVTIRDLPVLLEALPSDRSNFAVRELLAEPAIHLAGAGALPELMAAFRKNFEEGHDNDGFQRLLVDLAEADREGVRIGLQKLARHANKAELEDINWCSNSASEAARHAAKLRSQASAPGRAGHSGRTRFPAEAQDTRCQSPCTSVAI